MKREALGKKVMVLGIDGMDPVLTKKYLEEGKLPNIKKFIEKGVARKDLVMLGVLPTITPPSWTTLSTGAYPETHGITDFFRQSPDDLCTIMYNLDSRRCKAESMWDVTAKAGKKTLVWHWPGSAWPPTSDDPNLHVVDGTNPEMVNVSVAQKDWEKLIYASTKIEAVAYKPRSTITEGAGCIISNTEIAEESLALKRQATVKTTGIKNLIFNYEESADGSVERIGFDIVNSPIKEPTGWVNAPAGAREFTVVTSGGLGRIPALALKNEKGVYDTIALYKNKKTAEPYVVIKNDGEFSPIVLEEVTSGESTFTVRRIYKVMEIAPDGSELRLWMSDGLDIKNDSVWKPASIYKAVMENVGYVPALNHTGGTDTEVIEKLKQPAWCTYTKWQADAMNYLIEQEGYEVVFSHLHTVDLQAHSYIVYCKTREGAGNEEERFQQYMENVYLDVDRYVGRFMHLLDKDWAIMILSDHALVTREEEDIAMLADPTGVAIPVMGELGYTVLKKDQNGNNLREIDWEKTTAVNPRGNFIWVNLKGRNNTGIVDPADKDALEKKIIDDLYAYRDPRTGKRMVSFAMQNKDAALLGLSGPETGDIIFFIQDGFAKAHGDGLSTCVGYASTSLSPIFMAAGKGFKRGATVDRVVREVDIAPTVAVLTGVRMPRHCEGGALYQFLEEES